jgi:hypothetical protein
VTWAGRIELHIPKLRNGSYFPAWSGSHDRKSAHRGGAGAYASSAYQFSYDPLQAPAERRWIRAGSYDDVRQSWGGGQVASAIKSAGCLPHAKLAS